MYRYIHKKRTHTEEASPLDTARLDGPITVHVYLPVVLCASQ